MIFDPVKHESATDWRWTPTHTVFASPSILCVSSFELESILLFPPLTLFSLIILDPEFKRRSNGGPFIKMSQQQESDMNEEISVDLTVQNKSNDSTLKSVAQYRLTNQNSPIRYSFDNLKGIWDCLDLEHCRLALDSL